MKLFFFISLFFFNFQNIETVRSEYVSASSSKTSFEKFKSTLSKSEANSLEIKAYKAASLTLEAKYIKEIKLKKEYFLKGATQLNELIKSNPTNTELRLIRLSIQENTPKILKYKENIQEDKNLILKQFSKENKSLKEYIVNYFNTSKSISEEELKALK